MPLAVTVVVVALLGGACGPAPVVTNPPPTVIPSGSAEPSAPSAEVPFQPAAWPADGSACDLAGYTGLLGRIEAPSARTVRFTLCRPDGAFLTRLAMPALGIIDRAAVGRLAADRSSATALSGTGPYRIDQWTPGDNVRLVRVAPEPVTDAGPETVILRWAANPTDRAAALQDASVDGIDAVDPAAVDSLETQPELVELPRAGLASTYLGFGTGRAFAPAAVRRAIAGGIDRDALVTSAFPPGSTVAANVVPCSIQDACGGQPWYPFDAPAAVAALEAAGFDLSATYRLHVPGAPVPGLPDPAGVAAALQQQLATNLGLQVSIETEDTATYQADLATGALDDLYLGGLASAVPDEGTFLEPLFGPGAMDTPATRAGGIVSSLADAVTSADPARAADAYGRIEDRIRRTAVVIPLANPGSMAAFRADVSGAATSPIGLDPLGSMTPGDRRQLVFMQATEPDGAYCGDQASADATRLCGLVLQGLFGFVPGTLTPQPSLAQSCEPNADATVWTCRLRPGVRFTDGARLDARDVLATFVAQWDQSQPLRRVDPAPFASWDALFGGTLGG